MRVYAIWGGTRRVKKNEKKGKVNTKKNRSRCFIPGAEKTCKGREVLELEKKNKFWCRMALHRRRGEQAWGRGKKGSVTMLAQAEY